MKLSIVMPVYNEEAIIKNSITELRAFLKSNSIDYEIIVSNDGSTDATARICSAFRDKRIHLVGSEENKGKGSAVRIGMFAATGDVVMFLDADLAYGTQAILDIFGRFSDPELDICLGSRSISPSGYKNYPLLRKILSKTGKSIINAYLKLDCSDVQCGFKAFRQKHINALFADGVIDGFGFDFDLLYRARLLELNIAEMPVEVLRHNASKVKIFSDSLRTLRELYQVKRSSPGILRRVSTTRPKRKGDGMYMIISRHFRRFSMLYLAATLCVIRFFFYGFSYQPLLDDNIQYYNTPNFFPSFGQAIADLGLLASRPLSGVLDLVFFSRFYPHLWIPVFLLLIMLAFTVYFLHKTLAQHFATSAAFMFFFILFPVNSEGMYWLSASTRIIPGLFFMALGGWFFTDYLKNNKKLSLIPFYFSSLLSMCFYEQTLVLSVVYCAMLAWLNFKNSGKRWLASGLVLLNFAAYFIFTGFNKGGQLGARVEFVDKISPYYFNVFLPDLLGQFWHTFISAPIVMCTKGFVRGLGFVFTHHAYWFLLLTIILSLSVFSAIRRHKFQVNGTKKRVLWGLLLALAPISIFFVIANTWFSFRNTMISVLGLAIIADALIALLGKRFKMATAVLCAVLTFVSITASVAEAVDYRTTSRIDRLICQNTADYVKEHIPEGGSIAVILAKPSYLEDQNYFYHEHIHNVTESDWAFTGNTYTVLNSQTDPPLKITPIKQGKVYREYSNFDDYDYFIYINPDYSISEITQQVSSRHRMFYKDGKPIATLVQDTSRIFWLHPVG